MLCFRKILLPVDFSPSRPEERRAGRGERSWSAAGILGPLTPQHGGDHPSIALSLC
jgi:hypothetical protein